MLVTALTAAENKGETTPAAPVTPITDANSAGRSKSFYTRMGRQVGAQALAL